MLGEEYVKLYYSYKDISNNTTYLFSSMKIYAGIDCSVVEGEPIDIYVNEKNYGEYYVDVPQC